MDFFASPFTITSKSPEPEPEPEPSTPIDAGDSYVDPFACIVA